MYNLFFGRFQEATQVRLLDFGRNCVGNIYVIIELENQASEETEEYYVYLNLNPWSGNYTFVPEYYQLCTSRRFENSEGSKMFFYFDDCNENGQMVLVQLFNIAQLRLK